MLEIFALSLIPEKNTSQDTTFFRLFLALVAALIIAFYYKQNFKFCSKLAGSFYGRAKRG